MIDYIQKTLPTAELLAQLAEEAAELSQAALKLRRVYDGTNPTRTTYEDALGNLHEEIADIKLLLKVLELDDPNKRAKHAHIMQEKVARWERHLRKNQGKREKRHDPARLVELEAELAAALNHISARKECETCKYESKLREHGCIGECTDECLAADCVCRFCYYGSRWEWRGAHGTK